MMKIKYCHKMLKDLKKTKTLKMMNIPERNVPIGIIEIIKNHDAFSKSNIFGKKDLGFPQEYEKLIISEENETKIFEYFNKGIHYMMNGKEADRPIFQVFAHFMMKTRNKNV